MKNLELLSVIIPVYNVEKYLDECLESVVNQTYKNLEIILIDDGSSDASSVLCDQWALKDNRIRVIHQKNKGLSVARNIGFEISTGEFVYFLDSDDYIDTACLEMVMETFRQHEVDIVSFSLAEVFSNGIIVDKSTPISQGLTSPKNALEELLLGNLGNYICLRVYRRCVFDNIRFPEDRNFEDIGTTYKLFLKARQLFFLDKPLYYYRRRCDSITREFSPKSTGDLFVMRYTRYMDLQRSHPQLAEYDFPNIVVAAHAVYVRQYYDGVCSRDLVEAVSFLQHNREKVRGLPSFRYLRFFYLCPRLYGCYWKIRYSIKCLLQKLRLYH